MGIWSAYMAFSWHGSECECIGRRFIVGYSRYLYVGTLQGKSDSGKFNMIMLIKLCLYHGANTMLKISW